MALNLDHWRSLLKSVMDCWVPYKFVNTLVVNLWGEDNVLLAAEAALNGLLQIAPLQCSLRGWLWWR